MSVLLDSVGRSSYKTSLDSEGGQINFMSQGRGMHIFGGEKLMVTSFLG